MPPKRVRAILRDWKNSPLLEESDHHSFYGRTLFLRKLPLNVFDKFQGECVGLTFRNRVLRPTAALPL
jgi:hypothetical protein